MSTAEKVLALLADVTEVDEVRRNPDLRLYNLDILDSLKTIELIVAFFEKLGVEVSPAEFERDQWATPSRIDRRFHGGQAGAVKNPHSAYYPIGTMK